MHKHSEVNAGRLYRVIWLQHSPPEVAKLRASPTIQRIFLFSNAVIVTNTTLFFLQVYHSLDLLEILSGR